MKGNPHCLKAPSGYSLLAGNYCANMRKLPILELMALINTGVIEVRLT